MINLIYNNLIAQQFYPIHKGSQIDSETDRWRPRTFCKFSVKVQRYPFYRLWNRLNSETVHF